MKAQDLAAAGKDLDQEQLKNLFVLNKKTSNQGMTGRFSKTPAAMSTMRTSRAGE